MGVPKFFRWISERYPNLSVTVENNLIPEFDCLYLDMNGIIHVCSHPDDTNVQFRITEEQIFINIFKYIDFLFKTVKPKEVFFLAVDGVAPRAKMNQQRARRFKSSKETKDRDSKASQNGIILPTEKRFDSNAITPGTEFMDRLQQALKKFLSEKIAADNLWHGVDVILSGHQTPGEGEHKIQEFIRYRRSQPNYNPNTRHCLYGLDADLILLGLATHEPYFALLREEVTFTAKNKNRRAYIAEETKFFLLHLSLMRDYIDYEFHSLKELLGPAYDLERIIDDWIVLSFFIGNDFIPHLANLHIHMSALPLLWQTYIKIRPQLSSYINDHGVLNIENLLVYLNELSSFDHKHIEEYLDDYKSKNELNGKDVDELDFLCKNGNDEVLEKNLIDFDDGDSEEDVLNVDQTSDKQFLAYKANYYYTKMGLKNTPDVLANQAKEYFTALQWISYYYFSGVPSWSWFYPQHYAPFVSDLNCLDDDIKRSGISFEIGKPFLPFEQLMAVLPSDSSELVPDCFNILMTMKNSPIIDFYPKTFQTDLNGKKRDWEAVVLIPFIEEERLLNSLASHKNLLSEYESRRNAHGPQTKYRYTQKALTVTDIEPTMFQLLRDNLVFGLCPNVQLDVIYQGFPTFRHVEHSFFLERAFVRIFENHSTNESMVLRITALDQPPTLETVAENYIGKLAYVNWPTFFLCKVVAVLDGETRVTLDTTTKQLVYTPLGDTDTKKYSEFVVNQPQENYKRRAITLDSSNMLVLETEHSDGHTYEIVSSHKAGCSIRLERNWVPGRLHWHLHQLSVPCESVPGTLHQECVGGCTKLNQLCPVGSIVFCLDPSHYGRTGKVQSINNVRAAIVVSVAALREVEYTTEDLGDGETAYLTAAVAAELLGDGMDALLLSKITGSIFLAMGGPGARQGKRDRVSIGLDLKNNKQNLQVPGWVVKVTENGSSKWMYSDKVVDTLREYKARFPEVFEFIRKPNYEALTIEDIFGLQGCLDHNSRRLLEIKYESLRRFLDDLEYRVLEKLSNGHQLLSESQVGRLQELMDGQDGQTEGEPEEAEIGFRLVFRPHRSLEGSKADPTTEFRLLDRVVCCCEGYTVPLATRGTVIGIEPLPAMDNEVRLEVLFDETFPGAISIRGSRSRCYRLPQYALINGSHGRRRHHHPRLHANVQTEVKDQSSSSDLLLAQLFSSLHLDLPSMPTPTVAMITPPARRAVNVALADHRNGLPDSDSAAARMIPPIVMRKRDPGGLDNNSATDSSTTTLFDTSNCPEEYRLLFRMCEDCGVRDAVVKERHAPDGSLRLGFSCDRLEVPWGPGTRAGHASAVWRRLYALQRPPPPPYEHLYVPAAFRPENPFMAMYPGPPVSAGRPPSLPLVSLVTASPISPSAVVAPGNSVSGGAPTTKRFIRAPRTSIRFPAPPQSL